jgi:hypothetical protein
MEEGAFSGSFDCVLMPVGTRTALRMTLRLGPCKMRASDANQVVFSFQGVKRLRALAGRNEHHWTYFALVPLSEEMVS